MPYLSGRYAKDLYYPLLETVLTEGEKVQVRGRETLEILDQVTTVTEPWHHCILIPARRWNPWLALSEALWILAGRNDVAAIAPYNSRIRDFSDDGISLYGAYGARIYHQIDPLIARLRSDPSDRRAVLQIWDSGEIWNQESHHDLTYSGLDTPCNNLIYFKLRNNKLHMTVMCRSNDLHWGLFAVNLPTFGILQEYIAARLGVGIGFQTHLSNSLHIYTDDKAANAITNRMSRDKGSYTEGEYPPHKRMLENLTSVKSHEQFAEICSNVLDHKIYTKGTYPEFLAFANDFLLEYDRREVPHTFHPYFFDWDMAAYMFAKTVWK